MTWFANVNSLNEDIMSCASGADVGTFQGGIIKCAR
jgi:hypothetical protein